MPNHAHDTNGLIDIAIIGGGIAGLYCCLKLAEKFPNKTMTLYEAEDRLGGRIETWSLKRDYNDLHGFINCLYDKEFVNTNDPRDPWPPDPKKVDIFRAEFGPMRIEPDHQPLLKDLLDCLGMKDGDPDDPSWDNLVAFPSYAAEDPDEPKFSLVGEEGDQSSPLELLLLAIRRICELLEFRNDNDKEEEVKWDTDADRFWAKLRTISSVDRYYWKGHLLDWISALTGDPSAGNKLCDYDKIRRKGAIDGVRLLDMGFWNLLGGVLSPMAVVKIRDWASFYHLLAENPNAAEHLVFWLRNIKSSGKLRGIRGGMYRLVWKLEQTVAAYSNVTIEKSHRLKKLKLTSQDDNSIELELENNKPVMARRVILAIPKRPLEKLNLQSTLEAAGAGDEHSKELDRHLNSVFGFQLLKCFFIIEQPWWEDDRPLNRYASSIPTRELKYDKSRDKTKGMLMVYTDKPAAQFWSDYLTIDGTKRMEEQHKATIWKWDQSEKKSTNERLWRRFVQYARDYEHHDFTKDRILLCGMRDWGKDPYGAAAHAWRPGARSWESIEFLRAFSANGDNNKNIHICGEAYSDHQGFIEGSLLSAMEVIKVIDA